MSVDGRFRTPARAAACLLVAGLAVTGMAACSGESGPAGGHSSAPAAPGHAQASSGGDLDATARPAVAIVGQYTPGGYKTSPVASGYDWATASGQRISESLPGAHLFQIACSGSGTLAVHLSLPKGDTEERVECGAKAKAVPFDGKLVAVIDGSTSNHGAYAWRIVARA
ncbi:hypothetical protein GT034_01480 [Streptomyces sp. SID2563]|uniref:hypothetical protein n=1 Tax=Streptomyces sp. SID2563 TaxID=2690255 RepID=UPI00136CFEAC|nr:hypothetical protein [Streptomyces sp. SID2563]MYW07040.1 hypothetical protein [Streptomyces sp. SID2563]